MRGRILVVDDDLETRRYLQDALGRRDYQVDTFPSGTAALLHLQAHGADAVLTDLHMAGMNGLELCERVAANRPDIPVIVLTAFGNYESAVAAIRAGAYDFVAKPVELTALLLVLERAVQHHSLKEEVRRLRAETTAPAAGVEMAGESEPMRRVRRLIAQLAGSCSTVLITGESGTGKEMAARAIHMASERREKPFVAINCAAIPETLLESELFGYEEGAFTGARAARHGLFAAAAGGTLLLDEIGDMPLPLQAKVLRVLETRSVRTLGGTREIPLDVRVLASTNRDLEAEVEHGRFREDLFFRINVIPLALPPLRSRGNDVLLLAQRFLRVFSEQAGKPVLGISPQAAAKLLSYSWPGNVRELKNCIERAVTLTSFEQLAVEDLPEKIQNYRAGQFYVPTEDPADLLPLEEVERRYIAQVLKAVRGNKSLAARVLGFDRKTLYRKLEQFHLSTDESPGPFHGK